MLQQDVFPTSSSQQLEILSYIFFKGNGSKEYILAPKGTIWSDILDWGLTAGHV